MKLNLNADKLSQTEKLLTPVVVDVSSETIAIVRRVRNNSSGYFPSIFPTNFRDFVAVGNSRENTNKHSDKKQFSEDSDYIL